MHPVFAQVLGGSRWAIDPTVIPGIIKSSEHATLESIQAAVVAYDQRPKGPRMVGDVAVIDVCGPITYAPTWFSMYFGSATIKDLQVQLRAALADQAVRAIVWRFATPGGTVDMVPEFADEIFAARGVKPMVAVADLVMASAGYWMGSQIETVYVTKSSRVGAIGTILIHEEISGLLEQAGVKMTIITHGEHKADGNPFEPLNASGRTEFQAYADECGNDFDAAVARGRGVTKKVVLEGFGQGQVFGGREAIKLGLADKMGVLEDVVARLAGTKRRSAAAETEAPAIVDASTDAPAAGAAPTEPVAASVAEPDADAQAAADRDALAISLVLTS